MNGELIPFDPDATEPTPPADIVDYDFATGGGSSHHRPKATLPLKFWNDLDKVAPLDRLVRRLLGTTALALIFGEPGCGKTFLATDLGMHIACGWEWFGRAVTSGGVLYVACEGTAGISNRLAAFRHRRILPDDVPIVVIPAAVNLGPGGQDAQRVIDACALVETATGRTVVLVIIDTLARAIGAGDENSTQDMGAFIAACDRMRIETGATVLIVHHKGKGQGAGARGSSALLGAVDTAIEVEKRDAARVARVVKQKDGAEGQELGFELDVVDLGVDDEDEPITTCMVRRTDDVPQPKKRRVLPSGNAGVVLRALQRAIDDAGEVAPGTKHIPSNTRVVSPDTWRDYAYKMMAEANPGARQRAFKRAHDQLINAGYVAVWGAYAWMAQAQGDKT